MLFIINPLFNHHRLVMKNSANNASIINWGMFNKLGNQEFDDDIFLMSRKKVKMQRKTIKLKKIVEQLGLKTNEKNPNNLTNGETC